MYTREQASQLRQVFWTTLGQYLAPIPSAEGLKINWLNYKTNLKNVFFRMQADKRIASIAITLTHPDIEIQQMFFEQLKALKIILEDATGEEWEWTLHTTDENNQTISRIYKELSPVNVFNQEDWPTLISFFKPRIIALDQFWSDAQYSFDELR